MEVWDLQFKIKRGNLKVRSAKTFRQILVLKRMKKEEIKILLMEKMGVEFNG